MKKIDFINEVLEILELETLKPTDVLSDFQEWDSLAAISVMALFKNKLNITVTATDIANLKTFEDLLRFGEPAFE